MWQGIKDWVKQKNKRIRKLLNICNLNEKINCRNDWTNHITRMDKEHLPKNIVNYVKC